jgi:hypothetical protein
VLCSVIVSFRQVYSHTSAFVAEFILFLPSPPSPYYLQELTD